MSAHVIEHRGNLILRQFLDEPEQLLTLRAHIDIVRRPPQARRDVSTRLAVTPSPSATYLASALQDRRKTGGSL